ncbi:MAG: lipoprotein LipL45 [candidate division WS6 bacterium GW2011_GWA2_37_6]|uniref:Lipoprotein LipL45 n=1 Tax=candidate division WS6 bacterium GW2011_GWA2_37_6 TaxID=1619087 RepID=A0A0G0H2C6_9BACT|nr:MAG: lipoprotein LipL45 [candidate division WS6 bacterium GW2011_GWA2_37_6]
MAKKNKKRRSKKLLLIVAGALVLFLLIGTTAVMGNLVFTEKSKNTEFTLVKETGTIYYKSQDDTDYKELDKTEITLTSGSFVKTDKDSYAKIFLEDNSLISLDQSTEIQLDLKESSTNINQLVGRTWNRVRTVSKGGEYEVKTPNAIAAVRGTIFGIDAINNDHSIAFVIENSVDVSRYEKKGDEQNILETIGLSPDEMATIIRDDKSFRIEKQEIPDEFKNDFWFKRNTIIDEEYQKVFDEKGSGGDNEIDNKDFMTSLLSALQEREDYSVFRFGLTSPSSLTEENIQEQLKQVSDITKINEQTCQNFTDSDFQLAIDKVNIYQEHISNYEEILTLLQQLKGNCSNGEFTQEEIEQLKTLVENANNAV